MRQIKYKFSADGTAEINKFIINLYNGDGNVRTMRFIPYMLNLTDATLS